MTKRESAYRMEWVAAGAELHELLHSTARFHGGTGLTDYRILRMNTGAGPAGGPRSGRRDKHNEADRTRAGLSGSRSIDLVVFFACGFAVPPDLA